MDWSMRRNRALEYMEANLDGERNLACAAKLAFCSANSFSNMFLMATGIQNASIEQFAILLSAFLMEIGIKKKNKAIDRIGFRCYDSRKPIRSI